MYQDHPTHSKRAWNKLVSEVISIERRLMILYLDVLSLAASLG